MQTYVAHSPQHIAAKQLLDEMDQKDQDDKHKETLATNKRAVFWAKIAVIISVLTAIATIVQWLIR